MEIKVIKTGAVNIVSVNGRMDAQSAPDFEKFLSQMMDSGERVFIIDFGSLEYISSSGLRSILTVAKKLKAVAGNIVLASLRQNVKEVFEISGFSTIIQIFDSVNDAIANVSLY